MIRQLFERSKVNKSPIKTTNLDSTFVHENANEKENISCLVINLLISFELQIESLGGW